MPIKRLPINFIEAGRYWRERIKDRLRQKGDCLEFHSTSADKQGTAHIRVDQHVNLRVNRISYAAHFDDLSADDDVTFTCGNPRCVNPEHLRLKT